MLIGASFIPTLLRGFSGQQVVHHRLFSVVGIFRHQLLNLLIIPFGQLQQRLLGLLTGATTFTANEPAAGVRPGAEDATQEPFHSKQHHNAEDQDDHQARHAGFDIVVIGLDQNVALMASKHWPQNDPGDQQ